MKSREYTKVKITWVNGETEELFTNMSYEEACAYAREMAESRGGYSRGFVWQPIKEAHRPIAAAR